MVYKLRIDIIINKMSKQKLLSFSIILFYLFLPIGFTLADANTANISHSYHSNSFIQNGSIVSLDSKQSNYVDSSNTNNGSNVIGVVVATNSSLIALDPSKSTDQVAVSGSVNALVSNLNGDINIGDQIAVSPFNGIGMKGISGSRIVGLAQSTLNSSTNGKTSEDVTDNNGHKRQISVGYIRIIVAPGIYNSGNQNTLDSLQKFAQQISGHSVSSLRIALSLLVAFLAFISLAVLIFASINGSIVAMGRNPLAKNNIFKTLISVLIMAIITGIVSCLAIYVIIR